MKEKRKSQNRGQGADRVKAHPSRVRAITRIVFLVFGISLVVAASIPLAHADFKGHLRISGKALPQTIEGDFFQSGNRLRLDAAMGATARGQGSASGGEKEGSGGLADFGGLPMSAVVDLKSQKGTVFISMLRIFSDFSFNAAERGLVCPLADWDGCLKKLGFREVSRETVNGVACQVVEGTPTVGGKKLKQRIWRPVGLPAALREVVLVRSLTEMPDGKSVVLDLTNLSPAQVNPGMFQVPAGFRRVSGL